MYNSLSTLNGTSQGFVIPYEPQTLKVDKDVHKFFFLKGGENGLTPIFTFLC